MILLLLACASPPGADDTAAPPCSAGLAVGECPPDVSLVDRDGAAVSLLSLTGAVTVIASEAGWCSSCQELVEGFQALYADRADEGLVVVDVIVEDARYDAADAADATEWATYFGLTYPVLADPEGVFLPAWGGNLTDTPFVFYVLDGHGAVTWSALREDGTTLDQVRTAVDGVLGT